MLWRPIRFSVVSKERVTLSFPHTCLSVAARQICVACGRSPVEGPGAGNRVRQFRPEVRSQENRHWTDGSRRRGIPCRRDPQQFEQQNVSWRLRGSGGRRIRSFCVLDITSRRGHDAAAGDRHSTRHNGVDRIVRVRQQDRRDRLSRDCLEKSAAILDSRKSAGGPAEFIAGERYKCDTGWLAAE